MNKSNFLGLIFILVFAGAPLHAVAGIIYDNGPLALGGANEIGIASDLEFQLADDFVLSNGNTITDIHWWGTHSIGTDNFTIQFFEDVGGLPAEDPFISLAIGDVVETPVSFDPPFDAVFEYSVDIAPLTLELGVTYWISIANDPALSTWFWASAGEGNIHQRTPTSPDWTPPTFATSEVGFVLTDDAVIPIPPALWLFGSGLLGLVGMARRKNVA
jgi:hypothetical protein